MLNSSVIKRKLNKWTSLYASEKSTILRRFKREINWIKNISKTNHFFLKLLRALERLKIWYHSWKKKQRRVRIQFQFEDKFYCNFFPAKGFSINRFVKRIDDDDSHICRRPRVQSSKIRPTLYCLHAFRRNSSFLVLVFMGSPLTRGDLRVRWQLSTDQEIFDRCTTDTVAEITMLVPKSCLVRGMSRVFY